MSVKNKHKLYDEMAATWKMCRDASAGERAVHDARELYLPRLSEEEDREYNRRLKMTPWFNASWRTIAGLKGIMFRKPPRVEATESLLEDFKNIDLAGSDLYVFTQEVAEEALTVGRVGLMVDYPSVNQDQIRTLADTQALGLRALVTLYKAETIINWRTTRVNGSTVLSMVVLKEEAELPGEDEFDVVCEDRYRVLDLFNGVYRQRVFRIDDKDQDELIEEIFPLMNNQPLNYIPFIFIGTDDISPEIDEPPLIDLITTNFKHYGQATSYERGCFFSGLPTLFISGAAADEENPIYVGGTVANMLPSPDAKAYYVEIQGNFDALRTNLEDKKREMAVLGARLLETQVQGRVEAEATLTRRQVGEESTISTIAITISQGMTKVLQWFAAWQGVQEVVSFELNRDFLPLKMDAPMLTALMAAWQAGGISKETLFDNLKQGQLIADEKTFEEEEAQIDNQVIMGAGQEVTQ
jgi:hypothetical protein